MQARHSTKPERAGGWGKWITVAFVALGIYLGIAQPWRHTPGPVSIAEASAEQPEVLLYATSWCPYCAKTREFFRMHGIRYTEYDIEQSTAAAKGYRRLNGNGVPVVVVGERVVHGYNPDEMAALLQPWMQ